ncbi:MAG: hypothetical protein IKU25_03425 [Clostridia bacterium]|nr:hypothetical protein [Clostridia bacterium]
MSIKEKKIEKFEVSIESLDNYPSRQGIAPEELKRMFDARADQIKTSLNGLVDELSLPTAASDIGSAEGNVQRELDLKVDREHAEVIGGIRLETDNGHGVLEITPTTCGNDAEIKISDVSCGFCAALGMNFDGGLTVSYGSENLEEKENQGEVYTSLSHPRLDLANYKPSQEECRAILENLGLRHELDTGIIYFGDAYICKDGSKLILHRPAEDIIPESELRIGYDLIFKQGMDEYPVYHTGNLKDLTIPGIELNEMDKSIVRFNIGVEEIIGDIETALDSILAIEEGIIGGETA